MTEDEDIDGLAAEYVLGSLDGPERASVAARRGSDAALAAAIDAWQHRLAPLDKRILDEAPPAHVWSRILARISGPRSVSETVPAPYVPAPARVSRLRRRIAIAAGALAACLALAVAAWLLYAHPTKPPTHVAAMDCGEIYKNFWRRLDRDKVGRISAEQLAGVSRMALRAYDACQAGDALDADALFARLQRLQF